jgi:predicted NUDIX family phosphoesterase
MNKMDEKVACVATNSVLSLGLKLPGIVPMRDVSAVSRMGERAEFRRRGDIEEDESVLQIIPYVYLWNTSGCLFAYERTPKGGETRLRGKVSIGVGGHINPFDVDDLPGYRHRMIRRAALRELNEELKLLPGRSGIYDFTEERLPESTPVPGLVNMSVQGMMLLDRTAVDRVHLGVVYSLWLPRDVRFEARDGEVKALGWLTPKTIRNYNHLENWSQVLLPRISEGKITDA